VLPCGRETVPLARAEAVGRVSEGQGEGPVLISLTHYSLGKPSTLLSYFSGLNLRVTKYIYRGIAGMIEVITECHGPDHCER
jgi:hypothetical protein